MSTTFTQRNGLNENYIISEIYIPPVLSLENQKKIMAHFGPQ